MNNLIIETKSTFLPEFSDTSQGVFFFSYDVKIKNNGSEKVQLISRHWDIEDSMGRTKTVDGEGVIGKKPFIAPGEFFEYTSFCPLKTNYGYMNGFYTLKDKKGKLFKVPIPKFGLIPSSYIN